MKALIRGRMPVLLALLAATLLAIVFAPPPEDAVVAPRARAVATPPTAAPTTAAGGEETVLRLRPRKGDSRRSGLFDVVTPVVAAPVVVAAAVPTLPPLPFRVLGTYQDADGITVFLDDRGDGVAVRVGDTLRNETYRIDAISEEKIEFTYMPLQQQQTLALGEQH